MGRYAAPLFMGASLLYALGQKHRREMKKEQQEGAHNRCVNGEKGEGGVVGVPWERLETYKGMSLIDSARWWWLKKGDTSGAYVVESWKGKMRGEDRWVVGVQGR